MIVKHAEQPSAEWRAGVLTRLRVSEALGARSLCVGEQWFQPGKEAPLHRHPNAEEVVTVLAGSALFSLDGVESLVHADASVILPAGSVHGFANVGDDALHVLGIYSSASPLTIYQDEPDVVIAIGATQGEQIDVTRTRWQSPEAPVEPPVATHDSFRSNDTTAITG